MVAWFLWAIVGVGCLGLEIVVPGFIIFFFGIGGIITALFCLIPFVESNLWIQIILFVLFSVIPLVFLRRNFSKVFQGTIFNAHASNAEQDGIGKMAEVIETITSIKDGRIRFQGTTWKATTQNGDILKGSQVRIVSRNGMTYNVETPEAVKK